MDGLINSSVTLANSFNFTFQQNKSSDKELWKKPIRLSSAFPVTAELSLWRHFYSSLFNTVLKAWKGINHSCCPQNNLQSAKPWSLSWHTNDDYTFAIVLYHACLNAALVPPSTVDISIQQIPKGCVRNSPFIVTDFMFVSSEIHAATGSCL